MEHKENLPEILQHVNPALLDYQEWLTVGMALQYEGFPTELWEQWSQGDPARYHPGECKRKWKTFAGSANPVTGGTLVQMARKQGWRPEQPNYELDWDSEIGGGDALKVVDAQWLEGKDVSIPQDWNPAAQLTTYLETLFEAGENVGYVTHSWEKDGRFLPSKGCCDRTAGQLIQQLAKCNGDIGSVLGDYNPEAGAWIRFNPLDGLGVKDSNVTDYRYALVESDNEDISKQNAILRELELPIACLVFSGKKSLHAIVRIDAADYTEYRKRVDFLYSICQKNGLQIDQQNRNPSRLSRMPGVLRNGQKQYLLDVNIGKRNWSEWREWIEAVNDDLPGTENLSTVWDNLPELAPPLIDGILRQGHKMLISGPSKAGKSYALIELCCAIAEGKRWLAWDCTRGAVLYVNLELDRASCLHRFRDVYEAMEIKPSHIANIDIWNLRGRSVPMDKLAPKLIRRASKKNYIAIVIDPIYKIITGDENSADQMAHFCNQFDKVCTELGCAVIYCHHHSKGAQGGKRSMDRASGSGVFARDPDALLDLIELNVSEDMRKQEENKAICKACAAMLEDAGALDEAGQDDLYSPKTMMGLCQKHLSAAKKREFTRKIDEVKRANEARTAWRIEATLREFPKFKPVDSWFDFPVHTLDESGALQDVQPDTDSQGGWKKNFSRKKTPNERKKERKESVETAFDACCMDGQEASLTELAEYLGVTEKTMRNRLKEHGDFYVDEGKVGKKTR